MTAKTARPASVAEAFLRSLKVHGIETVFANAGTDFAPIIEALTRLRDEPGAVPTIVTVPSGPSRISFPVSSRLSGPLYCRIHSAGGPSAMAGTESMSRSNSAIAPGVEFDFMVNFPFLLLNTAYSQA